MMMILPCRYTTTTALEVDEAYHRRSRQIVTHAAEMAKRVIRLPQDAKMLDLIAAAGVHGEDVAIGGEDLLNYTYIQTADSAAMRDKTGYESNTRSTVIHRYTYIMSSQ